jgi:hypothetical protein
MLWFKIRQGLYNQYQQLKRVYHKDNFTENRHRTQKSLWYIEELEDLELILIQFNSILYYLCAESTAVKPITDTAQSRYK